MSSLTPNHRNEGVLSVAIGRWAVAAAPARIQTLLGSCVGVVLYDRLARIGGLAHVVLPNSRGCMEHPGKYADTAIPALLADMRRLGSPATRARLSASLVGGASMFRSGEAGNIGQANQNAIEAILTQLGISIISRDTGGEAGRRLTFDTSTGTMLIKIPGGAEYQL